jgi:disulfide bond formation protein DsbB
MKKNSALYLAWVVALGGMVISLYFGEVMNYHPCNLCWYQRICLFPLAYLLGVAVYTENLRLARYFLPISILGACIALYHTMEQWFPALEKTRICGFNDECAAPIFNFHGITFPILSLIGFVLISILLFIAQKK